MGQTQRKHPDTGAWIPLDEYERLVAQAQADDGGDSNDDEDDDDEQDLASLSLSRKDLYEVAKEAGLEPVWNDVTKDDLIEMIEADRG